MQCKTTLNEVEHKRAKLRDHVLLQLLLFLLLLLPHNLGHAH